MTNYLLTTSDNLFTLLDILNNDEEILYLNEFQTGSETVEHQLESDADFGKSFNKFHTYITNEEGDIIIRLRLNDSFKAEDFKEVQSFLPQTKRIKHNRIGYDFIKYTENGDTILTDLTEFIIASNILSEPQMIWKLYAYEKQNG